MQYKILFRLKGVAMLLMAFTLISGCAAIRKTSDSQNKEAQKEQEKGDLKPYNKVITGAAESDDGLFGVHKVDEKYYYEIPDSLLGREMLLVSRIAKTATGIGYGGEKLNTQI